MSSAATIAIPARSTPIPMRGYGDDLYPIDNPPTAPTVFVIDHDIPIRQSLELLILSQGWRPETCDSVSEFLARPRPSGPSCLILAFSSTDSNGLEIQRKIAKECADTPIVIIADYGDIPTTVQAMKTGAVDFLVKPFGDELLLAAIGQSLARSRAALERGMEMRDLRSRYASLTPREQQIMALVVSGLLNKQVGAELGISEITVKAHRGNVMRKMKADSFVHLLNMASRLRVRYLPQVSLRSTNALLDSDRMIPPAMRRPASSSGQPSLTPAQHFARSARQMDESFTAN
jgi:FixJ family two-component response regulator